MFFRLGFRNVLRNRRRSAITTLVLVTGIAALNLFVGYMADTLSGLANAAIHAEGLGHLIVYKRDALTKGKVHEEKYTLTGAEVAAIRRVLGADPDVKLIAPKLEISGLVTNGRTSVIFIGMSIDPRDNDVLKADYAYVGEGRPISSDSRFGAQVSSGLAEIMELKLGETYTLFSTTLTGQMNAVDMLVQGIYNTRSTATNDKYLLVPLPIAQELYDTDGASQVSILLSATALTVPKRAEFESRLKAAGLDVEVRTWRERSAFYQSVYNLYGMAFLFLFAIVFVVVLMSVLNTLTMSVMERIREIGTLRVLGLKRRGVLRMFAAEALILGGISAALGSVVTVVVAGLIATSNIQYTPPGISEAVSLRVSLLPAWLAANAALVCAASVIAATAPARTGARMEIVDALGHV